MAGLGTRSSDAYGGTVPRTPGRGSRHRARAAACRQAALPPPARTLPPELDSAAAWSLAAALSPRPRVRVADLDDAGRALNRYSAEAPLAGPAPRGPYALYLTDTRQGYRLLGFDLDPAYGPVSEDLAELRDLLCRAGLDRQVVCASGPGGGRHVWVALADGSPARLVEAVARALSGRLPSLDLAPLTNPATGCLRPPGAPHRLSGRSQVLTGSVEDLTAPTAGTVEVHALLALLDAAPARRPAARAQAIGRDGAGVPHLFGDRRPLPTAAQAALHDRLPAGADASAVLWTALLGAARARWRWADLLPLLPSAAGLEHARTGRSGPLRAARSAAAARRLLRRQWDRAVAAAATHPPTGADTGADPTFEDRCDAVVAAVTAVQSRAEAAPGRWARPGGPADRRVLDTVCEQLLAAVRLDVELDVRRLGVLCGVSRETARRGLLRLSGDGWVYPAAPAVGVRGARWGLPQKQGSPMSTSSVNRGVSQAHPRPVGATGRGRLAWRHTLHRRRFDQAHDVFTPAPGLGHHAGRVYGALTALPQGQLDLGNLLGYSPPELDRYLDRLAGAGLARLGPGTACRRGRVGRRSLAQALGADGTLAARRRRYQVEREAWGWWVDELCWMRLPRAGKRRRRDPAPGQAVFELPGLTARQRHGPHPRRADGRADYAAARRTVLERGRESRAAQVA